MRRKRGKESKRGRREKIGEGNGREGRGNEGKANEGEVNKEQQGRRGRSL